MDIFGRGTIEQLRNELRLKDEVLKNALRRVDEVNKELVWHKEEQKRIKHFQYLLNEDIPVEQNARKNYFSDITMFYTKIFKKKIAQMISAQKDALTILGKTEKEYDLFRSCVNVFSLLDDWFTQSEREHLSDLEEARQRVENSMSEVDEINRKYKQ